MAQLMLPTLMYIADVIVELSSQSASTVSLVTSRLATIHAKIDGLPTIVEKARAATPPSITEEDGAAVLLFGTQLKAAFVGQLDANYANSTYVCEAVALDPSVAYKMDPAGWKAAVSSLKMRCSPTIAAAGRFSIDGPAVPSPVTNELQEYGAELQVLFDKDGVGALGALDYWNSALGRRKPVLRKVWKYVGAMQATQTASERVFSYLRLVMGDHRWALGDGTVDSIVAGTANFRAMLAELPVLSSETSEEDVQRFEDLYGDGDVSAEAEEDDE